MANTTIKLKSHSLSNGWFNIETQDGIKISCLAEKNPKIKAILEAAPDGNIEVPVSLVQKAEKNYAWDQKEASAGFSGGGFKKTGSDESFALSYAKDLGVAVLESSGGMATVTADSIIKDAEKFLGWLKTKKA